MPNIEMTDEELEDELAKTLKEKRNDKKLKKAQG